MLKYHLPPQVNRKTRNANAHETLSGLTRHIVAKSVQTNVARDSLKLIDKHFPAASPLHKIFNRNTVKVSYSCMNNVKRVISSHNKRVLRETKFAQESTKDSSKHLCNCRNANECPLNNMCFTKDLVYQAEVITKEDNDIKTYIGMTATTFKGRYRNHKKSFEDIKHENDTELSKHVWK